MKNLLMTGYNPLRMEDNNIFFIRSTQRTAKKGNLHPTLFGFSSFIKTAQFVKEFVSYYYTLMLKINSKISYSQESQRTSKYALTH